MELVNCTKKYWEFVRKLRMDPRVEEGFVEKNKITRKRLNQEKEISELKNEVGDIKKMLTQIVEKLNG